MHGRIPGWALATLVLLMAPAGARAHDVKLLSVHASAPSATWDPGSKRWTLELAGMIDCDANSEFVVGAVFAKPLGNTGVLGVLQLQGVPRQVFRGTSAGLPPGKYAIIFAAAGCGARAQDENDEGLHGDSLENIELSQITLPDCDDPKAVLARFVPRPLIAVQAVPPDGKFVCPVPPTPKCGAKSRVVAAPLVPNPLVAVKGGFSVKPCEKAGSDQPAADARCSGGGSARVAGVHRSPLIAVKPGSQVPKSDAEHCYAQMELKAAPVTHKTCPRPLIAVPCEPIAQGPAMGYAAGIVELKHVWVEVDRGRRETVVLKLSKRARGIAEKPGTAMRFVITTRDSHGGVHQATSGQFMLDS